MKRLAFIALLLMTTTLQAQIDLHSHIITPEYLAALERHNALMDEGFPIPSWDAERHLDFMNRAGITTAVLTMPAPQPWFGDAKEAASVCRSVNEECAMLKARHPGRFLFCAALPLPDVKAAIEEARYALDVLDADGVKLATNAYGQYLGNPELDTLMAFLNERHAVIIIHPHKPSAVNAQLIADVPLASYEYLAETSRAVLNMIAHNVLVRYPHLKVVVPHCGSFLPNALPRFRSLLPVMVKQGIMQPVDVDANLARLYYDLAGAPTDDVLDALLTITTPDHILYGSDYPYVAERVLIDGKKALAERLARHGLDPQEVFTDNARRLFGEAVPLRQQGERIVRLAEIEVVPSMLEDYMAFAKEVGETSMRIEPGVLTLFSMQSKEDPCKIYILEIYADRDAYQSHIQTAHFKKYKEGTARMVKSLKLINTNPLVKPDFGKLKVKN
jgi:predicted TIM-barrel fold metal-dependent hydrolase/quinol monooxygenase YgiN